MDLPPLSLTHIFLCVRRNSLLYYSSNHRFLIYLLCHMENNNSTNPSLLSRLSTRMSMSPTMEENPPELLSRLTTPPPRKRKRGSSSDSNGRWISSGRENTPDSKRLHALPANWEDGKGYQTKKEGEHSTPTLPRSTRSLLSRMRVVRTPERRPRLWERLTSSNSSQRRKGSEKRLKSSWTKYPEMISKERRLSNESHERGPKRKTCPGMAPLQRPPEEVAASQLAKPCSSSAKTYQELRPSCELPATSLKASLQPNGTEFFEANPSTSIKSSHQCTLSNLMRRERAAWEELKLFSPWQNRSDKSGLDQNGRQPLDECQKRSLSFSPTGGRNYTTTQNTSKVFSLPKTPARI